MPLILGTKKPERRTLLLLGISDSSFNSAVIFTTAPIVNRRFRQPLASHTVSRRADKISELNQHARVFLIFFHSSKYAPGSSTKPHNRPME